MCGVCVCVCVCDVCGVCVCVVCVVCVCVEGGAELTGIVVFDEVYILFHFNIILKHNWMSSTKINNEGFDNY